jgi:hypothetical protein
MSKEDKKDYESMPMKELEKLYKERLANKLHSFDTESKEVSLSVENTSLVKDADATDMANFNAYIRSRGQEKPVEYMAYSDSECPTDISAWSPSENFVAGVWQSIYAESKLMGVTNVGYNISAGKGNRVDVRLIGKFDAPSELSACDCASCSSVGLSTHSVELKQYALGITECNFNLHDIGFDLYKKSVEGIGLRYAEFFDDQLFSALENAAAGNTKTCISLLPEQEINGSCCTDGQMMSLYNGLIDLITDMQEADYKPDTIIMSPSVARKLMGLQSPQPVFANLARFDANGFLTSFYGMQVIISTSANSAADSGVMAVVIDSRRALISAFGKRPFLLTEQSASCNSIDAYVWCYWDCAVADLNAVGHLSVA